METDDTFLRRIGQKIRELRKQQRLSQAGVAESCQMEKANLSRIEAGKTNFTILTLKKISEALKVDVPETLT